jgi:hypothetical protein
MTSTLRQGILQGLLESGWTAEALQQSLPEVEQHYLPTAPEFVGIVGKEYLDAVLIRVLPARLYDIWNTLLRKLRLAEYNHESFNLSAYVESRGAGAATFQRNITPLQARGLVTIQMDRRGVKRSTDFAGLYSLASEYHEWDQSEGYIAPEKELVELIRKDPLLVVKLRRFDVYRKVLYQGFKLKEAEITLWYTSMGEVRHD